MIIGYKKAYVRTVVGPESGRGGCRVYDHKQDMYKNVLVKLEILGSIVRPHGGGFDVKFRTNKAKVLEIREILKDEKRRLRIGNIYKNKKNFIITSTHDNTFNYETGKIVEPKLEFDWSEKNACSSGIYFYFEKKRAINY
jgi:hypothetical protein